MDDSLPLRDVVFKTLRQGILDGTLQPGERLMELHLAHQLGVSRTPVRDAIRKLEQEGLVLLLPRRGAVVAQITLSDLEDVLEVREALEELAARRACRKITPAQLKELFAAAEKFEKSIKDENLILSAEADVEFHEVLYEATGNRRLAQLLNNIRSQMYRYRLESLKNKSSHPDLILQHTLICEAVKNGDEQKAAEAVRMHMEKQKQSVMENLGESEA